MGQIGSQSAPWIFTTTWVALTDRHKQEGNRAPPSQGCAARAAHRTLSNTYTRYLQGSDGIKREEVRRIVSSSSVVEAGSQMVHVERDKQEDGCVCACVCVQDRYGRVLPCRCSAGRQGPERRLGPGGTYICLPTTRSYRSMSGGVQYPLVNIKADMAEAMKAICQGKPGISGVDIRWPGDALSGKWLCLKLSLLHGGYLVSPYY